MFGDVELGKGRQAPRGPQAVVIAQSGEAEITAAQCSIEIALNACQVVFLDGDMESLDHHLGGIIWRQSRQQLAP